MTRRNESVALEDVLNDYVASGSGPSKDALAEWIRRYPQYEKELTEFTVGWSLMKWLPPSPDVEEVDEGTLVLRGMSIVQNILHQKRQQKSTGDEAPLKSLLDEGQKLDLSIKELADLSELSLGLIRKLDRCLINFLSIPEKAIENIARILQRSVAAVTIYLQGEIKPMRAHYRAKERPSIAEKEDFFEAVRNDHTMSDERRQYWLSLQPQDD